MHLWKPTSFQRASVSSSAKWDDSTNPSMLLAESSFRRSCSRFYRYLSTSWASSLHFSTASEPVGLRRALLLSPHLNKREPRPLSSSLLNTTNTCSGDGWVDGLERQESGEVEQWEDRWANKCINRWPQDGRKNTWIHGRIDEWMDRRMNQSILMPAHLSP